MEKETIIPIKFNQKEDPLIVGRSDKKSKPDLDLGKDGGCSRETGIIEKKDKKIGYLHLGSTSCIGGFVLPLNMKT